MSQELAHERNLEGGRRVGDLALFGYAQTVFFFLAGIRDAGIFPVFAVPFALAFVFSWLCEHVTRLLRKKEEGIMNQKQDQTIFLEL